MGRDHSRVSMAISCSSLFYFGVCWRLVGIRSINTRSGRWLKPNTADASVEFTLCTYISKPNQTKPNQTKSKTKSKTLSGRRFRERNTFRTIIIIIIAVIFNSMAKVWCVLRALTLTLILTHSHNNFPRHLPGPASELVSRSPLPIYV